MSRPGHPTSTGGKSFLEALRGPVPQMAGVPVDGKMRVVLVRMRVVTKWTAGYHKPWSPYGGRF